MLRAACGHCALLGLSPARTPSPYWYHGNAMGTTFFYLYVVPGDKLPSPPPSLMTDFVLLLCSKHLRIRCVYGGMCAPAFCELWGLTLIGRTELGLVVSGEYLNE